MRQETNKKKVQIARRASPFPGINILTQSRHKNMLARMYVLEYAPAYLICIFHGCSVSKIMTKKSHPLAWYVWRKLFLI